MMEWWRLLLKKLSRVYSAEIFIDNGRVNEKAGGEKSWRMGLVLKSVVYKMVGFMSRTGSGKARRCKFDGTEENDALASCWELDRLKWKSSRRMEVSLWRCSMLESQVQPVIVRRAAF